MAGPKKPKEKYGGQIKPGVQEQYTPRDKGLSKAQEFMRKVRAWEQRTLAFGRRLDKFLRK